MEMPRDVNMDRLQTALDNVKAVLADVLEYMPVQGSSECYQEHLIEAFLLPVIPGIEAALDALE